jgi:peptidoglycan/LPS O-acetylase OafA/YrhL
VRQLRALTGLRFVAAFQVVVFHLGRWEHWQVPEALRAFGGAGFLAVTLFFVLSGFILTYTYLSPGAPPTSGVELYLARFARIYPVYLLGLLIAAPLFAGAHLKAGLPPWLLLAKAGLVLLMGQAYVPQLALSWNPPAWSISVEMCFYILFPLIAPRLLSCRLSRAVAIAAGGWLLAVGFAVAYTLFAPVPEDPLNHPWRSVVDYFPLLRLPDFVVGIVAGRLFLAADAADAAPPRHVGWLLAVGLLVPALLVAQGEKFPELVRHGSLLAPCFALVVYALAFGRGPLAWVLASRPLVALGEGSYALYVLHVPVMFWLWFWGESVLHRKILEEPRIILVTMAALVLLSLLVYRGFEAPLRARLRTRLIEARLRFLRDRERPGASLAD